MGLGLGLRCGGSVFQLASFPEEVDAIGEHKDEACDSGDADRVGEARFFVGEEERPEREEREKCRAHADEDDVEVPE